MPKYKITDPQTGKSVIVSGDSPPTEAESAQILGVALTGGGPDPDNPQDAHGLTPATKQLVAQNIPWMAGDVNKAPEPSAVPNTGPSLPSFAGRMKVGQPEPTLSAPVANWRQVAMKGVNALPEIGQSLGTAAGMAAAIPTFTETGGASAVAIPAGGGAGKMAGTALQTPLQKLILPESSPEYPSASKMGEIGVSGANQAMLDSLLMQPGKVLGAAGNAVEGAASKVGNFGRIPQRTAGRLMGESPNSERVDVALKNKLDLAGDQAMGQARDIKKQTWDKEISPLVEGAVEQGRTVSRDSVLVPVQEYMDYLAKYAPGGETSIPYRKVQREFARLSQYPDEIPVGDAQKIKQYMNQVVKNWESAMGQDEAQRPVVAADKLFTRKLNKGIGEATENPEKYVASNEKYGELADLLDTGTRAKSPLEKASKKSATSGIYQTAKNKVGQAIGRPLYNLQQFGKSGAEEGVDTLRVGTPSDIQGTEAFLGKTKYEPTDVGEPYERASGASNEFRPVTHPDWFQGLEPSIEAKNLGQQVDWMDYAKFRGEMPKGTPITPETIRRGIPQEPQKALPAPAMKGTKGQHVIDNNDLEALYELSSGDPLKFARLKKLLGMD